VSSDTQLLQNDANARQAALDIERSFIVQAPAGSGKTELLIQRYLRLLTAVSAPEEILAITFTRKAAAEMQVRVLQALQAAADGLEPRQEHERITARAARAALRRDQERGWNIAENPKRMRIQTLDSLNGSIARSVPLTSAGGGADTTIVANAEMRALYREAAALTLDQLTETGAFRDATREVLVHVDNNASLYIGYLSRMLATRDQWLPFVGSGHVDGGDPAELRAHLEQGLRVVVERHLEALSDAVPTQELEPLLELGRYAGSNLVAEGRGQDAIAALADVNSRPGTSPQSIVAWRGLADMLLTADGSYRKRPNKNQGFPAGDDGEKAALTEIIEGLRDDEVFAGYLHGVRSLPPLTYADEQWQVMLALFQLLPLAVMELKRLFAERSITDHIEVALTASGALGTAEAPGDVALLLDYQVRHLLIDEMQDTSSAQYRMIEALTGGWEPDDRRTLYCVGDPMQSIYRFRNAEVGQFLLSQDAGIGNVDLETLTLRRNFRSGEGLVDWFNDVFPRVLPAHDDPQRSAVSYSAAVPVPDRSGQGRCVVRPVFGTDRATEADTGLEVIRDVLDEHPDDDVAVLVRSRTHLPELLRRLRGQGIGYRAVEIDRLTDLPEIIDALALTRALAHQGDRHAWLAVLRSPWAGLDWTDLHTLVRNDRDRTVWELLQDPERLARLSAGARRAVEGVRRVMEGILAGGRAVPLRSRVERAWMMLGGPAILDDADAVSNVYHFLDVLEGLEVAGDLADVAQLEDALDQEHVSSHAEARLQVMTMHRAKGLQFDHVVLFGLGRIPRTPEPRVMSWFDIPDEHGRPLKVIGPVGRRAELEKDPLHSFIAQVEAEKDRYELGRLLYVACTRARKSLHLVGNARIYKTGMRPDKRSLLHLLWPVVGHLYDDAFDSELHDETAQDDGAWLIPKLRRFDEDWRAPDPPGLPIVRDAGESSRTAVDFYWVGSGARIAGTLVHRWIQFCTDRATDPRDLSDDQVRTTSMRWLREMGVAESASEPVLERTATALKRLADDERGRWLVAGDGHAELALTGVLAGRIESVVLDRVRIDDDGVHWIVDYKTSTHEGGDLEGFLAAETDRYRPQLARYSDIYRNYAAAQVRCALYFPLLQEFVEVDV
jgi:ATP-dependent exoDNAse (exonuclease V) beta subunit